MRAEICHSLAFAINTFKQEAAANACCGTTMFPNECSLARSVLPWRSDSHFSIGMLFCAFQGASIKLPKVGGRSWHIRTAGLVGQTFDFGLCPAFSQVSPLPTIEMNQHKWESWDKSFSIMRVLFEVVWQMPQPKKKWLDHAKTHTKRSCAQRN